MTERDLRVIGRVLGTSGGLVLDFSNRTFSHFFDDFGVNIDGERFLSGGTSKANRLRTFLRETPPPLNGRIMHALLELRLKSRPESLTDADIALYRQIAERLSVSGTPVSNPTGAPEPPVAAQRHVGPAPTEQPPLRLRLTNGEHPDLDSRDAQWNGDIPAVEKGGPEALHDIVGGGA
ncbi:MAG: hypothetical protein IPI49_20460 [Myxococcales bacterium]|nr:hypothetical protein [Myxococcales bacterium]